VSAPTKESGIVIQFSKDAEKHTVFGPTSRVERREPREYQSVYTSVSLPFLSVRGDEYLCQSLELCHAEMTRPILAFAKFGNPWLDMSGLFSNL